MTDRRRLAAHRRHRGNPRRRSGRDQGPPKDLIKVGGAAVAPAELELVLREHPSVRDAAVVGRPDAAYGEVPIAYVVPTGSPTTHELLEFVGARVGAYKHLHDVRIVDGLPRTPSGKLLRRTLRERERAAGGGGEDGSGEARTGGRTNGAPSRLGPEGSVSVSCLVKLVKGGRR